MRAFRAARPWTPCTGPSSRVGAFPNAPPLSVARYPVPLPLCFIPGQGGRVVLMEPQQLGHERPHAPPAPFQAPARGMVGKKHDRQKKTPQGVFFCRMAPFVLARGRYLSVRQAHARACLPDLRRRSHHRPRRAKRISTSRAQNRAQPRWVCLMSVYTGP